MKVIIAGSRTIRGEKADRLVEEAMSPLLAEGGILSIVSGCAAGIDEAGERWARRHGYEVETFPAEWRRFGAAAGPIRNRQMAEVADVLVLIWDGRSRGSADMRRQAMSYDLRIEETVVDN